MKSITVHLLALLAFTASAFAQDLPASVTEPFLRYEQAMGARDYATAEAAGEQAWRASEAAGLDFDLQSALVANYAEIAMARGNFAGARDGWQWSANLALQRGASRLQIAHRHRRLAEAQLALGDVEAAAASIEIAARQLPEAVSDPAYYHVAPETYLLAARIQYRRGQRLRDMGRYAQLALPLIEATDSESWNYAEAAYYAAIDFFNSGDMEDAAYYFLIAENGIEALTPEDEYNPLLHSIAVSWGGLTRYLMSNSRENAFERRVAASTHPWAIQPSEPVEPIERENVRRRDAQPTGRTPPVYPREAAERGLSGFVIVRFDVDPTGTPQNVEALFAAPEEYFAGPAIRAVENWSYQPRTNEHGEGQWRRGVQTTIEFRMSR